MRILWRTRRALVSDVQAALPAPLAYTTVLSILQNLEEKGFVEHESDGRRFSYRPVVTPSEVLAVDLEWLLNRHFEGSAEALIRYLREH